VIGENGLTTEDAWADGLTAYRSVAVPGFPNQFMPIGTHSAIGNQSLIPIAEDRANSAMRWIKQIRDGRIVTVAPTEVATKEYNDSMKAAMPQMI
jgi:cation diffusion facilitator CzcD-associated flavoprotein CzcO